GLVDPDRFGECFLALPAVRADGFDVEHAVTMRYAYSGVNALRIVKLCRTHSMDSPAERLRKAREIAGYETAAAAARALNIKEPTYYGHENGSRGLRRDEAIRYSRFFRVDLDWLLTGRGDPKHGAPSFTPVVGYVGAG